MTKEGCGMYDGWMNLASLLLGLSAWFLPLWGLRRQSRKAGAEAALWCWAGALCCAAALYFQLRYGDSYVQDGDWSALMDTSGAAVALWFSAGNFLRDTACGPVCRPLEEAERRLTKCSGYLKKFMLP